MVRLKHGVVFTSGSIFIEIVPRLAKGQASDPDSDVPLGDKQLQGVQFERRQRVVAA